MTIFLTTTIIEATRVLMAEGILGQITTPGQGNVVPGVLWGADNECFLGKYRGDDAYLAWLDKQGNHKDRCVFASCPDVPADWHATIANLQPMADRIREHGFPATIVAQDGMTLENFTRWDEVDAVFLGGTNAFKLGPDVRAIVREAKERGKWVHMGRVNSFKRFQYAHAIGCDSADGTLIAFAPSRNIPKMREWANALNQIPIDGIDVDAVGRAAGSTGPDFMPNTEATAAGARRAAAERAEERAAHPDPDYDPHQPSLFDDPEQPSLFDDDPTRKEQPA